MLRIQNVNLQGKGFKILTPKECFKDYQKKLLKKYITIQWLQIFWFIKYQHLLYIEKSEKVIQKQ